jgi:hypothetical protein
MATAIPGVEIANHGNVPGIWRPDGKANPRYAVNGHGLRPETMRQLKMPALIEKVKIDVA